MAGGGGGGALVRLHCNVGFAVADVGLASNIQHATVKSSSHSLKTLGRFRPECGVGASARLF